MPELPEVETVRRGLASHIVGATCTGVSVLDERILRRHGAPMAPHPSGSELAQRLQGRRIVSVQRRGKFLWMPLATDMSMSKPSDEAVTVHLGMSGQLLLREPMMPLRRPMSPAPVGIPPLLHNGASHKENLYRATLHKGAHSGEPSPIALALAGPHVRARLQFVRADGQPIELSFVDQRLFGRIAVEELADDGHGRAVPSSVAAIAPDPLEPAFADDAVVVRMRESRATVKALLLDQRLISGVGNIYADEALWRARIYWARTGRSIAPRTLHRLLEAVREVFAESLAQGGTSFDSLYINVNGESGRFSHSLNVYGRAGEPCPRCGTLIRRERFGSRSSYRCPRCQRSR
jgi:formamidopyrimidine-DNA glycosylase